MEAEEHLRAVRYLEIRLLRCSLPADHPLGPPPPSLSLHSSRSHLYSLLDDVVKQMESGNYLQALSSPASQSLFTNLKFSLSESAERFYKVSLSDCVNSFLGNTDSGHGSMEQNIYNAFLVMAIGVAALLAFIQCNFTGPLVKLPWVPLVALPTMEDEIGDRDLTEWEAWARKELTLIGPQLRGKLSNPEYIIFARILLMRAKDILFEGSITSNGGVRSISWWASRLLFVHQRLFHGPSSFLFDLLQVFMRESLRHFGSLKKTKDYWGPEMSDEDALNIVSMLHLEATKMELYYGQVDTSRLHLKSALETSKLHSFVIGTLDFRTLHQVEPKEKIHLVAGTSDKDIMMSPSQKSNNAYDSLLQQHCETSETSDSLTLPGFVADGKSSESNEKVRLQANATFQLKEIHQAVILAHCLFINRSPCNDELQKFEMAPYIEAIDSQHSSPHILRYVSSLLRIRRESTHCSTKQNALLMMEKLVQGIHDPSPGVAQRIDCYFGVDIPSISELRKELGDLLMSCGLIEEAVKVYEDLEEISDNLIYCYQQLDKKAAAIELINKQLSKTPFNSRLRHLLGVIKGDDSCKVSGSKSALERRYLAHSAQKKRRYIKPNVLWKSVSASSSMNPDGLFALGIAFLKSRDLEKAVDAFTRAVEMYPKNREAWSNLACLHKQRGDLVQLTEALWAQLGLLEGSAKWRTDLGIFVKFAHVSLEYSKVLMERALRNKSIGELRMAEMHLSFTIENAGRFSDTEEFGNLVALYREVDGVRRALWEHRVVFSAPSI